MFEWKDLRGDDPMNSGPNRSSSSPALVAIACWFDLLGYGAMMDAAGFDPSHAIARKPLARLRAFHRIVAKHSSGGFPTLVMNDGAVAYSNVELVRSDKVWRFIERCWALYGEATVTDQRNGGPGLRAVIAVGLRAKGSNRGIVAQDQELTKIVEDLASGMIDKDTALDGVRKVRRVFDVVPPLQANFAFARAYSAEQDGSEAGLPGPSLYLDTAVFKNGLPDWFKADPAVHWAAKRPSMATGFVAVREIGRVTAEAANRAFKTGQELLEQLRFHTP